MMKDAIRTNEWLVLHRGLYLTITNIWHEENILITTNVNGMFNAMLMMSHKELNEFINELQRSQSATKEDGCNGTESRY